MLLCVTGASVFVRANARAYDAVVAEEEERVQKLALLLAAWRGRFVTLCLDGGGTTSGWVFSVEDEELVVHLDVRKLKRTEIALVAPEGVPVPTDLQQVALSEIERVEGYTEEVPAFGDVEDLADWE